MTDLGKRDRQEMQRLIALILDSPLTKGKEIKMVDGEISLDQFKDANTNVKTRILLQMSMEAMRGGSTGIKCADFLFKYGGFEPPKEQDISLNVPTFVDDMTRTVTETQIEEKDDADKLDDPEFVKKALEEAKDKPDVVTDTEDIPISDISDEQ